MAFLIHDEAALTARIAEALDDRAGMAARGLSARRVILDRCDREKIYPEKEALLTGLL